MKTNNYNLEQVEPEIDQIKVRITVNNLMKQVSFCVGANMDARENEVDIEIDILDKIFVNKEENVLILTPNKQMIIGNS